MSKTKPISTLLPTDSAETRDVIGWLQDHRVSFVRHSRYHLKIGELNYYLGKGTIFFDSEDEARSERGFAALQQLLTGTRKVRTAIDVP